MLYIDIIDAYLGLINPVKTKVRRERDHPVRRVRAVTEAGFNKIFASAAAGAKFFNLASANNIYHCIKGDAKSAGKYEGNKVYWAYIDKFKKDI